MMARAANIRSGKIGLNTQQWLQESQENWARTLHVNGNANVANGNQAEEEMPALIPAEDAEEGE